LGYSQVLKNAVMFFKLQIMSNEMVGSKKFGSRHHGLFQGLTWHLSGETEENHKNFSQDF
jgi:hypothetical protein